MRVILVGAIWINWLKLFKVTTRASGDARYLSDLHEESAPPPSHKKNKNISSVRVNQDRIPISQNGPRSCSNTPKFSETKHWENKVEYWKVNGEVRLWRSWRYVKKT